MNLKSYILIFGQLLFIALTVISTYYALADVAIWKHAPAAGTLLNVIIGITGFILVRILGKNLLDRIIPTKSFAPDLPAEERIESEDEKPAETPFTFKTASTQKQIKPAKATAPTVTKKRKPRKKYHVPFLRAINMTLAAVALFVNFIISQGILMGDASGRALFFFFLLNSYLCLKLIHELRKKGEYKTIE